MPSQPSLKDLNLVTLRLLLTAIEEGNLAKAAVRANISVSSISRRLSDLETRMGVTLLHRHDRGVRPTAAALSILPRIRDSLGLLEQAVDDLADFGDGTRGTVRIHTHMTALAGRLPALVQAFRLANPQVEVEIDEVSTTAALHSVRVGTCDLAMISGTVEAPDFDLIVWDQDELVVALPADHALAARPKLGLREIVDQPFIGMQRDSALLALYRRETERIGKSLKECAHVTGFDAVRRLVSADLGISILPGVAAIASDDDRLVYRPLAESWARRPLMLATLRGASLSAATQRFIAGVPASS